MFGIFRACGLPGSQVHSSSCHHFPGAHRPWAKGLSLSLQCRGSWDTSRHCRNYWTILNYWSISIHDRQSPLQWTIVGGGKSFLRYLLSSPWSSGVHNWATACGTGQTTTIWTYGGCFREVSPEGWSDLDPCMQEFDTVWHIMIQRHILIMIIRWYDMMWFGNPDYLIFIICAFPNPAACATSDMQAFCVNEDCDSQGVGSQSACPLCMWFLKRKWDQVLTCQ